MSWILLFIAGVFEVVWAVGLKLSDGMTKPLLASITIVAMVVSVVLLGIAMKHLPVGTAYAVWTGIGAIGAFVFGAVVLSEPTNALRLLSALLIVVGVIGLKVSS